LGLAGHHGLGSLGLVGWGPLASENGGVKIPGVRVNLACAAGLVRRLASGDPVLIASEILQNFAWLNWLAVVGKGASAPGVVCADNHGLGSLVEQFE
jgi:hypothetical protein